MAPTTLQKVTLQEVNEAARDVAAFVRAANRKLFELETLGFALEIQQGNVRRYPNARAFVKHLTRKRV